jgi:hypothetical protein
MRPELNWDDDTVQYYRKVSQAKVNLTRAECEKRDSIRFFRGILSGLVMVAALWIAVAVALAIVLG